MHLQIAVSCNNAAENFNHNVTHVVPEYYYSRQELFQDSLALKKP